MKLSVLVRTVDYRGDHTADVTHAVAVAAGETVEALAERLLSSINDVIEIRMIMED